MLMHFLLGKVFVASCYL